MLEVGPDDEYLRHVMRVHGADILKFQPDLVWDGAAPGRSAFLVQRGDETVGLVLLRDDGDGVARVQLDYVTPRYRDFSPGEFVWRKSNVLRGRGFASVLTPVEHGRPLLRAAGFPPRPGDRRLVARALTGPGASAGGRDPALEGRLRRAGVDGLGGPGEAGGQALLDRARLGCVHRQRGSGVEQDGVADRPGLAGQHTSYDVGVVRRVLAPQILGGPWGMPSAAGSSVCSTTSPSLTAHRLEVVVVVSSSSPSSPRKTHASTPRRAKTPAITGAIRRSAHPTACASGLAGLAIGPRKLNVVPTPSSRRAHGGVPQRRVERGGEAERDPGLGADPGDVGGGQVQPDARGAPARRRCRTSTRRTGCRA